MRALLTFLIAFSMAGQARAQYQINLIMSPTPPATLSEWNSRREALTLIVGSQSGVNIPVKIKTEFKTLDGTIIATTDLAKAATFTFQQATTILYAGDVVPLENMIFTGKYKNSQARTGKLPSDQYTLCVQLVTAVDYRNVSEQRCRNFFLATTQLPILMKPYNEEILDSKAAQTAIIFRWSPVVPRQTEPILYRIQVFEVLGNQTPVQALRSNQPLLDQRVMGSTQYIWRPMLGLMDCCASDSVGLRNNADTIRRQAKLFIWTIQSLDAKGDPVTQTDGSGEARSEPLIFYIKNKSSVQPRTQ